MIRQQLHDLSQSLTRLQWRLELGRRSEDSDELRQTIERALADSKELVAWLQGFRAAIEAQTGQAQGRAA